MKTVASFKLSTYVVIGCFFVNVCGWAGWQEAWMAFPVWMYNASGDQKLTYGYIEADDPVFVETIDGGTCWAYKVYFDISDGRWFLYLNHQDLPIALNDTEECYIAFSNEGLMPETPVIIPEEAVTVSDTVAPNSLEGPDEKIAVAPVNLPEQSQPPLASSLLKQKRRFQGSGKGEDNKDNTTSDKENHPKKNQPHSSSNSRPLAKKFKPNGGSSEQTKANNIFTPTFKPKMQKKLQLEEM